MKRFEKATALHEFLHLAAFEVVRRDGAGALTRRAVAAELGISDSVVRRALREDVHLAALAARACRTRRRDAGRRQDLLAMLLPGDEEVDVEVVWLRLVLAHGAAPRATEVDAEEADDRRSLRSRYDLAVRGRATSTDTPAGSVVAPDGGRRALEPYLADHRAERRSLVVRLVGERADLVDPVLALTDGLVLARVTGLLDHATTTNVLLDHLRGVGIGDGASR